MLSTKQNLPRESEVRTLEQYLQAVNSVYRCLWPKDIAPCEACCPLWFRGVRCEDYALLPCIARPPLSATAPQLSAEEGCWSRLFEAHRSGMPTRILEWTKDALAALLFAVDIDEPEQEKNPIVWCLNPYKLNEVFDSRQAQIPELPGAVDMPNEDPARYLCSRPMAVCAAAASLCDAVQQKVYTVFPWPPVALENLPCNHRFLRSIVICKACRKPLVRSLCRIGVTKEGLFPADA